MTDRFIGPNRALIINASARIAKLPAIAASSVGKKNSLNFEFSRLYLLSYGILVTVHFFFKRNHLPFEAIIISLM